MEKFNLPMFLLAVLVVLMFCFAGVALAYGNFVIISLFLLLGFLFMGYGLYLKRKSDH